MTAPSRSRPRGGVLPAHDRLAERARAARDERRSRRLKRALLVLTGLTPVALVAWAVLVSGLLAVERQTVTGTGRLQPAQVLEAAAVADGTPLARVDVAAVRDRVEQLAPVAAVEVRRDWPRTLELAVTERVPVAGVLGDGGFVLVDAEGVPFATEPALPPGVVRLQVHQPGPEDGPTGAALAVHAELPPALREQVAIVRAESPSAVQLRLRDGRTVVWGAPGDAPVKAAAATALLELPGTVVDVSAPGVVTRR